MNLFWKKLFGELTPTAKLEKNEADLVIAMNRYAVVENSVELAEYKQLFQIVETASFKENKKTLQNRKYKDTEEYQDSKKHKRYQDSKKIQMYYHILGSVELKNYLVFKTTPEYQNIDNKKLVKASEKLQKMKKFENSKEYKTYVRFHNSYIITEFEKLKAKIATPEFKKRNEYWANEKRWLSTPEYIKDQRFNELSNNADIKFFINEKPERFAKYRAMKLTFNDEFSWNSLNNSNWNFGFHYKSAALIGNHSFANEKQANNSGKNIGVEEGLLKITTKRETITARAWHTQKGFIQKEFSFTSDVVQTADKFRQKYGIFRAKIRCTGNHHAFWLGSDAKLPQINIFHSTGKHITLGNANKNLVDGIKVTGINPCRFYIYTLVWTEKELTWMINNLVVYRTASNIPKEEMYLAFNSFITEKQRGTTGSIEIDWVRVYENK